MTESEIFEFFHNLGIVPVVKIDDAAKAEKLAEAMIKGGIPCAEVTFRTDAAEEAMRRMDCLLILHGSWESLFLSAGR